MIRKTLVLAAPLFAVAALIAGCGSSGDKTASVGTSEVTVAEDTPVDDLFEGQEVVIKQLPYLPWFEACQKDQLRRLITPEEAERIESMSEDDAETKIHELILKGRNFCGEGDRPFVDPNASTKELDLLRSVVASELAEFLRVEGAPDSAVQCVEDGVGKLPHAQVIVFLEDPERAERTFFKELALSCE